MVDGSLSDRDGWSSRSGAGSRSSSLSSTRRGSRPTAEKGLNSDHSLAELSELGANHIEGMVDALRASLKGDNALLHRREPCRMLSLEPGNLPDKPEDRRGRTDR